MSQVTGQNFPKERVSSFDDLYLATTLIEMFSGATKVGSATGFFYQGAQPEKLFLITNRHVVVKEEEMFFPDRLRLRLHKDASDPRVSEIVEVSLYKDDANKRWIEVSASIDVVAIEVDSKKFRKFHIKPLNSKSLLPSGSKIGLAEPLVILGYPLEFYDDVNNLPVVRQGAVASAFPVPFKGEKFFLVDAILHEGMSGSPVFTRPGNASVTDLGQIVSGRPPYLIGIYSAYYTPLNLNCVWFTSIIEQLVE